MTIHFNLDARADMAGMRVQIHGLEELVRDCALIAEAAEDMRELMHSTGTIVANEAKRRAPIGKTGRLAAAPRAGRGRTKAVVRVRVPREKYAGVVHYGNPHRGSRANRFVIEALDAKSTEVFNHVEQGITELLKKHNFVRTTHV